MTLAMVVLATACMVAVLAVIASEHHQVAGPKPRQVTVLTGVAYVGDQEASVTVGNWVYGIQGTGKLTWIDSQGAPHDSGWPACLTGPGYVPIKFGEIPVTAPGGGVTRQIVWVDCRY